MKEVTKKDLIRFLDKYDDATPIRLGAFCDEIKVMEYKKIFINSKPIECIMLSDDEDDNSEY